MFWNVILTEHAIAYLVEALCYKSEFRTFDSQRGHFFSVYSIFPATLDPGVYFASNRNEYQKQKNNVFAE
jgi:hypothetical protein